MRSTWPARSAWRAPTRGSATTKKHTNSTAAWLSSWLSRACHNFDRGWHINPKGIAYIQDERSVTYTEAGELSCQVANALLANGFSAGTKGAVWSNNDVTAWICTLGLWRANLTWIPVGARNVIEDNQYILDMCDCEIIFFQQYYAEAIAAIRPLLPKVRLWVCIDADLPDAPSLATWVKDQAKTDPCIKVDLDADIGFPGLACHQGATGEQLATMADEITGLFATLEEPQAFLRHDLGFHRAVAAGSTVCARGPRRSWRWPPNRPLLSSCSAASAMPNWPSCTPPACVACASTSSSAWSTSRPRTS